MAMNFEELDSATREYMLSEFESEQSGGNPYPPRALSPQGLVAFPNLMREAIRNGNEETLKASLSVASYWNSTETYVRDGVTRERRLDVDQAAERLALTEFNTWYVRGLARRLMDEGVAKCQAYRAAMPKWEPGECQAHEGQVFSVAQMYDGHRAKYWPEPGDPHAISIPFGPGCHHTIRRVRAT
jgi:hypothetical protein